MVVVGVCVCVCVCGGGGGTICEALRVVMVGAGGAAQGAGDNKRRLGVTCSQGTNCERQPAAGTSRHASAGCARGPTAAFARGPTLL